MQHRYRLSHTAAPRRRLPPTWLRAVASRDPAFDGRFVFAVSTTGIFCRPSCPARRPAPRNVSFFHSPADALRSGFRPCARCLGRDASLGPAERSLVHRICRGIESALENSEAAEDPGRPTLDALARQSGLGRFRLHRLFRRVLGVTPRQYADAIRLRRFKKSLRQGGNVTSAIYDAGYGSASRLYERAASHLGMTPGDLRRGAPGLEIRYAVVDSPLGRLLVGATARGVCAVMLGRPDAQLVRELAHDYPRAHLREDARGVGAWARAVVDRLRPRPAAAEIPLDIRGTAFQRRVWEELQRIPPGQTRTYSEIARRIGKPQAARAVGRACATNSISVVVPCHRAVGKSGSLTGYRWGLQRKQVLLETEKRQRRTILPAASPRLRPSASVA
ncbi:MAG TPA: bifunctional DNA-binding transcriptional regulator/O6-methylguanine-DNA methyltransferase Ada [Candidatus Acidoferrales bacterium]|nr:bifunctional DNA-binding transcriptional regulator/O6-methylguanine-DNA methyltransferase Ada [Candidatus Acidoferrales bacterium]